MRLLCFTLIFILCRPHHLESTEVIRGNTHFNPLTSHVLDTSTGKAAINLHVTLSKHVNGEWHQISKQLTNADGRVGSMISLEQFTPARYKLTFDTLTYYGSLGENTFYPYIDVVFEIERPDEHYHVPLLLSAYGYSTYRGS